MLKDFLWSLFERTGNIEAYLLYREIVKKEKIEVEQFITEQDMAINS